MKIESFPWLERFLRNSVPVLLTLALIFLGALPLPIPGNVAIAPMLTLISVYFWSIYRPDLFPLTATFGLGIAQDVVAGTPIGMSALVLLFVQGVVIIQRRFFMGKTFVVVWWCFILISPVVVLLSWLLVSAYYWTLISPQPLLLQNILTILIYPCLTWLLAKTQPRLAE